MICNFKKVVIPQAENMSKTLVSGDTRVAVNLTGRYLLVTAYKDSILGWVRHPGPLLACVLVDMISMCQCIEH